MSRAVIAVVVTALVFDFTSGFHDTAASAGTGAIKLAGPTGKVPVPLALARHADLGTVALGIALAVAAVAIGTASRREPVSAATVTHLPTPRPDVVSNPPLGTRSVGTVSRAPCDQYDERAPR